jgi:TRAP-type mannitol/chloroaromatic compound transport system permease small subunit
MMQDIWRCELGVSRGGEFAAPAGHSGEEFSYCVIYESLSDKYSAWIDICSSVDFGILYKILIIYLFTISVGKYFLKCQSMKE